MLNEKTIKCMAHIIDDDKFIQLEQEEGSDSIIIIWLKLIDKAHYNNGFLEYSFKFLDNLTDNTIKTLLRYKNDDIGYILNILEKYGFICRKQNKILIIPFWLDKHDRNSYRYKLWRSKVFERDNYECKSCGSKKYLQAHHIIRWENCKDKELRYDIENGITLCRKCHLKEHNGNWRN